MRRILLTIILLACAAAAHAAEHVVVIGLDGCRPEAIQRAGGPVLKGLIAEGAVCWHAKAVTPSVTQVNWSSMLSGSTPAKTGIDKHPIEPQELAGMKVKVPTVFESLAGAGKSSAGLLGHWKLYPLEKPVTPQWRDLIHFEHSPGGSTPAGDVAAKYIEAHKPTFLFVWFGDLDGAGHKYGWLSPEQLAKMSDVDRGLDKVLGALDRAGIRSSTLVVVTSDHGGHGKNHTGGTDEDVTIPWIAAGPGVRKGYEIQRTVNTYDTAATVLFALGVAAPKEWDGKPVTEAFEGAGK